MPHQEMNIKQIIEVIKFSLEASKRKTKLPVCLWGIHGTGKTDLVHQTADQLGYNLIVLHLAMQDICDLIGIPSKLEVSMPDGTKDTIQIWSCPQWLHDANENYKKTGKPNLFFLDEFNRGNRFVLAAMLPFLIEGVLHQHHIGPEDAVIAAANPANEKYEVNELTDEALLNRMGHVVFKPTHGEYVNFLKSKNVDQTTIKVVQNHPAYTKITDFELGFDVKPSRRSIFNVMSLIGSKNKSWLSEHGSYVIEAYLGQSFRDEWMALYSSKEESITLDMLMDFENNRVDIENCLTTVIDGQTTHRTDVLSRTLDIIKTYIKDKKDAIDITDITWMTKLFMLPIIPDDSCAAIFMANAEMKRLIMKNVDINIALTNFLRKKKILQFDGIQPWEALSDAKEIK